MAGKLRTLASDWRDDAANEELNLTGEHRDALNECAKELEAILESSPSFINKGDSEAQFIADGERLNCPSCGGSGHVDDVQTAST